MRSRRSFFPKRKEGESLSLPLEEPLQPASGSANTARQSDAVVARSETTRQSPVAGYPRTCERKRLWLGLLFPELVLEVHTEPQERTAAIAIVEERDGQRSVRAMSAAARKYGIAEHMTLAAALALRPELVVRELDERKLRNGLTALAQFAETYTATTCLQPPAGLLLEIGGSLRLFGGLKKLAEVIKNDFSVIGHSTAGAIAPTPQAAIWMAGWRPGSVVTKAESLNRALRNLPLTHLGWPIDVLRRFEAMGVRTLGDCERLPRSGLARRFGAVRLLQLDRAYGRCPDLRQAYRAPESFSDQLELGGEISATNILLEACQVLLERLSRFLMRRQSSVQTFSFGFYPLRGEVTTLDIRFNEAGHSLSHWLGLLEIKIERLELSAPVIVVELRTDALCALGSHSGSLPFLAECKSAAGSFAVFVECLRARLGSSAVRGVDSVSDIRPELAIRFTSPEAGEKLHHSAAFSPWHELKRVPQGTVALQSGDRLILQRPLWVLEKPHELAVFKSTPCYQGQLAIFNGPERIETGWWDGRDTARDYYVAANMTGMRVWIFRERLYRKGRWYLHGLFG